MTRMTTSRRIVSRLMVSAVALVLAAIAVPIAATAQSDTTLETPRGPIAVDRDIPYVSGDSSGQTLDVYRQDPGPPGRPSIVMVHGGGWVGGAADDMAKQAQLAASQGWVVFNINYRGTSTLGNDGQAWPTELDDVRNAITWVTQHAQDYSGDPTKVAVLGASAGGNLAALAVAKGDLDVKALAVWSAPTDLAPLVSTQPDTPPPGCGDNSECTDFWTVPWVVGYLGCEPSACPNTYQLASPLDQVGAKTPPTYIANSSEEIVPVDQATNLARALNGATVRTQTQIVDGSGHAYDYTSDVWNDMMPFLASSVGVAAPQPIDFSKSPIDLDAPTLVMIFLALILLATLVIVAVKRERHG